MIHDGKSLEVLRKQFYSLKVYIYSAVGIGMCAKYPHKNAAEIRSAKDATFMHGGHPL